MVDKLLADLVRFESLSHEEEPVADYVEALLQEHSLRVGRVGNNVFASVGKGDNGLLLTSHLDVVPPSASHPHPPFEPTRVDNRLYGRGTVDAKASVASMIATTIGLRDSGWTAPSTGRLIVAFTACEERGGGYNGLEHVRPHLPNVRAAVVGEPTSLQPCTAQKGLIVLDAEVKGVAAHAGRPELGRNAVVAMASDVLALHGLNFDRVHPLLGRTFLNVTQADGGTAHNAIPDRCSYVIDVRTTPSYAVEEIVGALRSCTKAELSIRSDRYVPVETSSDEPIVQAAVAVTGAAPVGSPTASDWIYLRDLPVVKIGPGNSELSHTAEESIDVAELEQAVAVYSEIVQRYFQITTEPAHDALAKIG